MGDGGIAVRVPGVTHEGFMRRDANIRAMGLLQRLGLPDQRSGRREDDPVRAPDPGSASAPAAEATEFQPASGPEAVTNAVSQPPAVTEPERTEPEVIEE